MFRISAQHRIGGPIAMGMIATTAFFASACAADPVSSTGSAPTSQPSSTGPVASSQPSSAPAAKDTPVARTKVVLDAQGGGAGKALCTLFSTAEMSEWFGADVGEGEISGPLDSACQWSSTADTGGSIMIQRVPASYWSAPSMSKGYKPVSGIGTEAYTAPGMFDGEWDAAALHGKVMTVASLGGSKASADNAKALLKEVLARG